MHTNLSQSICNCWLNAAYFTSRKDWMVPLAGAISMFALVRGCSLEARKSGEYRAIRSPGVHQRVLQATSKCGTDCGTEAMGTLTERTVQTAKVGRHSDGDGLLLVVKETGRKTWVLRYQVNRVRRDKALAPIPRSVLRTPAKASADRALIARGADPIDEHRALRKAAKPVPTFGDIASLVIADAQSKSTNAKVRYQWERHLGSGPIKILARGWIG